RAVESVGPRVVRALQRLTGGRSGCEHGAAMAADVQEGAQLPFAVSRDDDRDVAHASREKPSTVAQLTEMADVLPGAREDSLAFTCGQLGIRIGPPRERLRHADSLCRDPGAPPDPAFYMSKVKNPSTEGQRPGPTGRSSPQRAQKGVLAPGGRRHPPMAAKLSILSA